jgi:hypothetical protein
MSTRTRIIQRCRRGRHQQTRGAGGALTKTVHGVSLHGVINPAEASTTGEVQV